MYAGIDRILQCTRRSEAETLHPLQWMTGSPCRHSVILHSHPAKFSTRAISRVSTREKRIHHSKTAQDRASPEAFERHAETRRADLRQSFSLSDPELSASRARLPACEITAERRAENGEVPDITKTLGLHSVPESPRFSSAKVTRAQKHCR